MGYLNRPIYTSVTITIYIFIYISLYIFVFAYLYIYLYIFCGISTFHILVFLKFNSTIRCCILIAQFSIYLLICTRVEEDWLTSNVTFCSKIERTSCVTSIKPG